MKLRTQDWNDFLQRKITDGKLTIGEYHKVA